MKKMKIIGFLASVLAISACSLKASPVSREEFKKLYQEHLAALKMGEISQTTKAMTLTEEVRSNIRYVDSEFKEGEKFYTSHKEEHRYAVSTAKKDSLNKEFFQANSSFILRLADEYRQSEYKERDDGVGNILHDDEAYNGNKIEYSLAFTVTSTKVDEDNTTYTIAAELYSVSYLWYEFEHKDKKGNVDFKWKDIATEEAFPADGDKPGGKYGNREDMDNYILKTALDQFDAVDLSLDTTKTAIENIVDEFYAIAEVNTLYDTAKAIYNNIFDNVEATIDLAKDATHDIEIVTKDGNYAYRSKDGNKVTETIVSSAGGVYNFTQFAIRDGDTPDSFYFVKIA